MEPKMKVNDRKNFVKTIGITSMYRMGPSYGDGVKDPTGNDYTTASSRNKSKEYSQTDKETLAAYKIKKSKKRSD